MSSDALPTGERTHELFANRTRPQPPSGLSTVLTLAWRALLMPMTFASDIFVSLQTMPGWLRAIVEHNPVTFLATAARKLMHGQPAGADSLRVLASAAVILAIAIPIAMRLYRKER